MNLQSAASVLRHLLREEFGRPGEVVSSGDSPDATIQMDSGHAILLSEVGGEIEVVIRRSISAEAIASTTIPPGDSAFLGFAHRAAEFYVTTLDDWCP